MPEVGFELGFGEGTKNYEAPALPLCYLTTSDLVMGKLGRGWVGAWVVHGMVHGWGACTTWIGDVGLGGWEVSCW